MYGNSLELYAESKSLNSSPESDRGQCVVSVSLPSPAAELPAHSISVCRQLTVYEDLLPLPMHYLGVPVANMAQV